MQAELELLDEPRADAPELHDPELAAGGRLGAHVAELMRQFHRAAERLVARVQVDLLRGGGVGLARRRVHDVLAELHAGGELALAIAPLHGHVPHLARELRRAIVLLGRPHRRGATQPHVDPQAGVAERLGQRGQLGEPLHPVPRPPQHVERPVTRVEEPHALLRRRGRRQRQLDDAQDLLRRVGGERVPARLDREPDAHGPVPRRLRVTGDEGQAGGRGFAGHQQRDDRRMDRPARGRRERRSRELADLLVLEAVVGSRGLLVLGQQPRRDGRRQGFGELLGLGRRPVHAELDLPQVLQAEPPAQDRRDGQQRLRGLGQLRRAPRDQRLHRGRNQPIGVAGEGPDPVDLLDHPVLAVGERHLLDDERDSLGLRVHHRRARCVDRTAEHLHQELARRRLREAFELQAADDAHAAHVGDQVHGLVDDRELLGTDREHQEDRARAVGPDHVAQQTEAVLVRPLEIVDEDRERPFGGQGPERDGPQVERAEQPAVGSERGEPGVVLARHRVQTAGERLGGLGAGRTEGLGRTEDRPGDQERAAELLVGRDGDRGEAIGRRPLGRGDQQPRLADPGLTLHRETDEATGAGRRQLLGDRLELGRPADHVAGRPVNVEGHRREGQRSVVVRDQVVSAGSGCERSRDPALRHAPAVDQTRMQAALCGSPAASPTPWS